MRLFIGITLPPKIRTALTRIQTILQETGLEASWTKPENLHLTLKFLGEVENTNLEKIIRIMDLTARKLPRFTVDLTRIEVFPPRGQPRIIWINAQEEISAKNEIMQKLSEGLGENAGSKETREFSAHITLARIRSIREPGKLTQKMAVLKDFILREKLKFCVEKITLFKSELFSLGAVYTVLKEVNLKRSCRSRFV